MSAHSGMDVKVENHGSVILVRPLSDAAREWLDENISGESTWFGGALACEPRYLEDLVLGMQAVGPGTGELN